jgi:hypothetical protein
MRRGPDPTDPQTYFRIDFLIIYSLAVIGWNTASGRVYSIYWSSNLLVGFQTLETKSTVDGRRLHRYITQCFRAGIL